jgi:hypothetical protein
MKMNRHCRTLAAELALTLLLISGCQKKKPAVPQPQAQAPTVAPSTTTTEPANTAPTTAAPATAIPSPAPPEPEKETQKPSPIPQKRASRSESRRHSGGKKTTNQNPPATVAKNIPPAEPNPTPEPAVGQISPDMSKAAQSASVQSTTKLLDDTEQNLRSISRTLSTDEQNTVSQIRGYMVQSRSALRDQDFERAHNLAVKAHSLADGLLKQ